MRIGTPTGKDEAAGQPRGRREFLKFGAMAGAAVAVPSAGFTNAARVFGPVVETRHGKLRGFIQDGIHAFRGIPYGAPTGGASRFRAPAPPASWSGVLNTLGWGASAPQGGSTGDRSIATSKYALAEGDTSLQTFESEDCLSLNVWTPSVIDGARRPVMVWLHGGGFWSGTAATAVHDGENLSRYGDVVLVSCNHRLNAFGFTYLAEPGFEASGNVGMLDIVLALQWVRDNIDRFGGDPSNVTVFGYSGGGQKVSTLMAMPQARGLFHKAIVQSGQTPRLLDRDQASDATRRLCERLGIDVGDAGALQSVPSDTLLAAQRAVIAEPPRQMWGFPSRFSPVVDGVIVPAQPLEQEALLLSADIPLMIGNTRQEMAAVTLSWEPGSDKMSYQDLPTKLAAYLGDKVTPVLAGYRRIYPTASPWDLFTLITADAPTRINSIRIAERRHRLGRAPVFMYRVDWQTPVFDGVFKAPHGLEVPLMFRNVQEAAGINGGGPEALALSEHLSAAWVAFARGGNPSTSKLRWPAYDLHHRATMVFDRETRVVQDPDRAARILLEQVGPQIT